MNEPKNTVCTEAWVGLIVIRYVMVESCAKKHLSSLPGLCREASLLPTDTDYLIIGEVCASKHPS